MKASIREPLLAVLGVVIAGCIVEFGMGASAPLPSNHTDRRTIEALEYGAMAASIVMTINDEYAQRLEEHDDRVRHREMAVLWANRALVIETELSRIKERQEP